MQPHAGASEPHVLTERPHDAHPCCSASSASFASPTVNLALPVLHPRYCSCLLLSPLFSHMHSAFRAHLHTLPLQFMQYHSAISLGGSSGLWRHALYPPQNVHLWCRDHPHRRLASQQATQQRLGAAGS